ncbi:hypothetical protein P9112_002132 [Eukaryota sp. TZLM1-RC]
MQNYWKITTPLFFAIVVDAFSITLPSVIFPELLRSRFQLTEGTIGSLMGVFDGVVSLSLMLSSLLIGHFSDFVSRKFLLLIGLSSNALSLSILAYSTNIYWIFISRILGYSLNATWVLCSAFISDLTKHDSKLRCLSFAYSAAAFSLARALASGIGGVLVLDVDWGFLYDPFSLPILFAVCFQIFGALIVSLYVHDNRHVQSNVSQSTQGQSVSIPRVSSVINSEVSFLATPDVLSEVDVITPESSLLNSSPDEDPKATCQSKAGFVNGLLLISKDKTLLQSSLVYCFNQLGNGTTLVVLVLFNTLPLEQGGLGFTPRLAGIHFLIFGLLCVSFQVLFFKRLLNWLSLQKVFMMGSICIGVGNFLSPFAVFVSKNLTWPVLFLSIFLCAIGWICGSCALSMTVNCNKSSQTGLIHGALNSAVSIFRMIGSLSGGLLFGFFLYFQSPFLIGVWPLIIYLLVFVLAFRLPNVVNG